VSLHREKVLAGLIVAVYLVLAIGFSLNPIFEGPDELEHFHYVWAVAETHALPTPGIIEKYQQGGWGEFHQPILYYALLAPVMALAGHVENTRYESLRNPYYPYEIGVAGNDNKNIYAHPRAERFPYRESRLARTVHLLRLVSVLLGIGTLLTAYAIFRLLWPDRPDRRLLGLGFVAFMPQFIHMSSRISNDILSYWLATLAMLLVLRQLRDGPSWSRAAGLGMVLGLALLAKLSTSFLIFPVGLATLLDRRAWRYAGLTVVLVLILAGWWYVRNWSLYGEPTGAEIVFRYSAPFEKIGDGSLALDVGLRRMPFVYQSFWARFGGGSVAVGRWIYTFFDALTVLTCAGLGIGAVRFVPRLITWLKHFYASSTGILSRPGEGGAVNPGTASSISTDPLGFKYALAIGVSALAWILAVLYWSSRAWSGNQGRFLLPGIATWGALVAWGLDQWTPRRVRLLAALGTIAVFGVVAAICLFGYFLPAYRVSSVPEKIARPLSIQYGEVAQLIGMSPAQPRAWPGETIRVTLYWRALRPADTSLQAYLHSVDSNVVRRDSLPGTGNLLSTDWQAGETWAERYVVSIPADAPVQTVYPLIAGLYDPQAGLALTATDGQGHELAPIIGRIAINGPGQPFQPAYRFGNVIGLAEPHLTRLGDQLEVCLRWLSLAETTTDYHVFVHVLGEDGTAVAQSDFQPRDGMYPTGTWSVGEAIDDCVKLDVPGLPERGWQVALGLYTLEDGSRLPVRDQDGRALPDDTVLVSGAIQ
jgi:4-amino-4-deoxy-L-arabinose transferase-like glycosyltransferase